MSPRPILLLSAGRSGSHLLRSFFQPAKTVLDVREFLNPVPGSHDPARSFWAPANSARVARLQAERLDPKAPQAIFEDYMGWLVGEADERTLLADLKYDYVGPVDALWRPVDEPPPPVAAFIAAGGAIIHLVRRNPLAQIASMQLAVEMDFWVRHRADAVPDAARQQVRIGPQGLVERLRRIELRKLIAEHWVERAGRRLTLVYEDLLDGDRLAAPAREAIAALCDKSLDFAGRAGTLKIAPPLVTLLENAAAVRAALAGSEFAWCVDEDRPGSEAGLSKPAQRIAEDSFTAPAASLQRAAAREAAFAHIEPSTSPVGGTRRGDKGTVLLARELPESLGGIVNLFPIAERLAGEGFRPVLAVPDAGKSGLSDLRFPCFPAPRWPAVAAGSVRPDLREYAELLVAIGFADPGAVAGMAAAWDALIEGLGPVAIIADHSPGLVVARQGGPVPVISVGDPTTLPPITSLGFPPLLSIRRPRPPVEAMIGAWRSVGRAAARDDAAGLASLFATPERLVVGLPEFDPYRTIRHESLLLPPELDGDLPRPAEKRRLLAVLPPDVPAGWAEALAGTDFPSDRLRSPADAATCREAVAAASHVFCPPTGPAAMIAVASGRPRLILRRPGAAGWPRVGPGWMDWEQSVDTGMKPGELRRVLNAFLADGEAIERARVTRSWFIARQSERCTDRIVAILGNLAVRPAATTD